MLKIGLRIIIVLILLALVGGGIWYFRGDLFSPTTTETTEFTQIVTVERGNLAATISVVGELYAPENATLAFDRLEGKTNLLTLNVAAGNTVEAGQILATIDPTPYEQALDQAQSALQEAEATLADLLEPPTDLAIAQAELAIAQADLAVQQAQNTLDELINPDVAALQADVADAQLALTQARASLSTVENEMDSDDALANLRQTEGENTAEYTRLANETYTDAYYQDRLHLARNAMLAAQDARMTLEIERQIDLLTAQINVRKAQQTLADALESLQTAQTDVDELDLAQAQYAVAQADVDLAQARVARSELDAGPDEAALAAAQSAVERAQQSVADADADLAAATLRAPFSGTVLQTNAAAGNSVTADDTILTLANLDELQVVAAVDETTIRQVAQGQAVQVTFDAFPDQSFQSEVLAVPLQGELQGDVMVYEVPISLPGSEDLPLLVGMTANAEIQVGQAEDVLLVPSMAIQGARGRQMVLVPGVSDPATDTPATPVAVDVEVGLSDGIRTEIVSGLNEGDPVLVQMSASDNGFGFGGRGFFGGIPGGGRAVRIR